MEAEFLALLAQLHKTQKRQGPGGDPETEKALMLAALDQSRSLSIADIGCGTGASALTLARCLDAEITAIDFLPDFIDELGIRAEKAGLSHKISPHVGSMDDLPFSDGSLDAIWFEGAIYNIGFENGLSAWRRFLKPGGVLVASEITWITNSRPNEVQTYWEGEYPEIDTASSKLRVLEACGYAPLGYFVLPENCWIENYYQPLQERVPEFVAEHPDNELVASIAEAEKFEREIYLKFKAFYSYGVYIARKI